MLHYNQSKSGPRNARLLQFFFKRRIKYEHLCSLQMLCPLGRHRLLEREMGQSRRLGSSPCCIAAAVYAVRAAAEFQVHNAACRQEETETRDTDALQGQSCNLLKDPHRPRSLGKVEN